MTITTHDTIGIHGTRQDAHGIVRRGHVMLLSGKGKGAKTWAAIQLAVAVATGGSWFGYKCEQGDCLYIDPELDPKSLDNRFHDVCDACRVDPAWADAHIQMWCLRGALTCQGYAPTQEASQERPLALGV